MEEEERRVTSRSEIVSNPFADRDNFPGVDRALGLDDVQTQHEQRGSCYGYEDRISPDQSICSHQTSASLQNSSLNMSIGARAALYEHLRHVALHGLDGGQQSPTDTSLSFERLPQDEVWERLMDGNLSITSASSPTLIDRLQAVVSISEDGEEAVEVVADSSGSDFFDSSRIWQLSTPEKNKGVHRSITTRRGPDEYEESDSGSQESGMMYLYNVALGMHADQGSVDHSTSLLSLGVDLSRISNSDVSDIRSSPDEVSFHQRNMFEDFSTQSPARRSCRIDPSFSTPSRQGIWSPEPSSMFSPSRQSVSTVRTYGEKENYMNDIGLSPIAAQAGSIAVKIGRPSRRHYPGDAFPSYSPGSGASPNELVNRMRNLRMDEPSPISRANSGHDMRTTFPTVSENCILDMEDKGESSKSASSSIGLKPRDSFQKRASSLNSTPATASVPKQHSPSSEDRRRYRTVVPSRVFMDDPENFPIQEDSFSSRSATANSTSDDDSRDSSLSRLPARSLLVSFDDAVDEYEVPLNDS